MVNKTPSSDEDTQRRKKPRAELRKRYQTARKVGEVLVNGANLRKGHIAGSLKEVIPNGQELSLIIKDDFEKVITCIFSEFTTKVTDFNSRIGRRVNVALTSPERIPTAGMSSTKYPYNLRFHQYCFTIESEMFEDTKNKEKPSYIDDSESGSDEEVPSPPPVVKPLPERQTRNQTRDAAPNVVTSVVPRAQETRKATSPSSLMTIEEALNKEGQLVNIAGIITKVREARQFSKGDWGLEIHMKDDSCEYRHLEVKLYVSKREHLPDLMYGDGILLNGLKIHRRNGYLEGIGPTNKYRYCCFSKSASRVYACSIDRTDAEACRNAPIHTPTEDELRVLQMLVHGKPTSVNPRQEKEMDKIEDKLIEELEIGDVFNCTVQLLHVWTQDDKADLRVTDYTSNTLLKDPKDISRYQYPKGNRTLLITLFDKPADQARTLETGQIYRIPRVRFSENNNGYVQGRCGKGKDGTNPVILKMGMQNPLAKNILLRKQAFESGKPIPTFKPKEVTPEEVEQPKKAARPVEREVMAVTASKVSTTAVVDPSPPPPPIQNQIPPAQGQPPPIQNQAPPKTYPAFPEYSGEVEVCDSIVCAALDNHPLKSIDEIDNSQECPGIFRFHGRIVDVEPANLNEAIISTCLGCDTRCETDHGEICSSCKRPGTIRNRVQLLITFQDASGLLGVRIGDEAAEKFFRFSKAALQLGNRKLLLEELGDRFQNLYGPRPGVAKYEIGGISEVMSVVVKSWHVREGPSGLENAVWYRRHRVSGCRVNLQSSH